MTDTQQKVAAKAFAKNWKDRGYGKRRRPDFVGWSFSQRYLV